MHNDVQTSVTNQKTNNSVLSVPWAAVTEGHTSLTISWILLFGGRCGAEREGPHKIWMCVETQEGNTITCVLTAEDWDVIHRGLCCSALVC